MNPTKLMKIIGDADDEYILSALASRKNHAMKQSRLNNAKCIATLGMVLLLIILLLLLCIGCGKDESSTPAVIATSTIEVEADLLTNVSVTLPNEISRETVSSIQHDFIKNDKQVGGIVIVDISDEMLDSPLENSFPISNLLGQQLMSGADPKDTEFMGAGGNDYAYMEVYTGGDDLRYIHHLFRGNTACYDVWFDLKYVEMDASYEILATVSSTDITAELNENPF